MLGMAVRVNPTTIAELLLEADAPPLGSTGSLQAIDAVPLTPQMYDAAVRLARCLRSPVEARGSWVHRLFARSFIVPCAGAKELPCEHWPHRRAVLGRSPARFGAFMPTTRPHLMSVC